MSAHVLFNLLNELGKKDKMRVFANKFNKFNSIRVYLSYDTKILHQNVTISPLEKRRQCI